MICFTRGCFDCSILFHFLLLQALSDKEPCIICHVFLDCCRTGEGRQRITFTSFIEQLEYNGRLYKEIVNPFVQCMPAALLKDYRCINDLLAPEQMVRIKSVVCLRHLQVPDQSTEKVMNRTLFNWTIYITRQSANFLGKPSFSSHEIYFTNANNERSAGLNFLAVELDPTS